jgi:hypothetical protein
VVQRSPNCTFSQRAAAAEALGAAVLVVVNTVEGIYRNRTHATAREDFDCDEGEGSVASLTVNGIISFTPFFIMMLSNLVDWCPVRLHQPSQFVGWKGG